MPNYEPTSDPYGIDLRREFAAIMRDHGTWGLLRKRVGNRKKASSYNESTGEAPQPGEKSVLASGDAFIDYLVRYRRMTLFDLPEQQSSAGREGPALVRFYLQWQTKPDVHDFLIELAQNEATSAVQIQPSAPYRITRMWDIQEVTPMRERGGRVEFWQIFVKEAVLGGPS